MVQFQGRMFGGGPYEVASGPTPPPSQPPERGPLPDLKEIHMRTEIADMLEIEYLSEASGVEPAKRVEGILWGLGPVQRPGGKAVNVFFLVDTTAPVTELSPSAFAALGCDTVPTAAIMSVGGYSPTHVRLCDQGEHSNRRDVSMVGADLLADNTCVVQMDYPRKVVTICFT